MIAILRLGCAVSNVPKWRIFGLGLLELSVVRVSNVLAIMSLTLQNGFSLRHSRFSFSAFLILFFLSHHFGHFAHGIDMSLLHCVDACKCVCDLSGRTSGNDANGVDRGATHVPTRWRHLHMGRLDNRACAFLILPSFLAFYPSSLQVSLYVLGF